MPLVHIAVEGCCHGELDAIYSTIEYIQTEKSTPIELLLVCGDFECIRDSVDLACVAVPSKYRKLTGFDDYVSGRKRAPVLTIFVGGNHEASNVLYELYYGGWVAPNIYFLGFGGVVNYRGIRIGGLSGIYNARHYRMGHFETPPFSDDSMRSVYHVRELEVYRMAHMSPSRSATSKNTDIFLSHDWPANVWKHGDCQGLLRKKKFLAEDINSNRLGSPPLQALLEELRPSFWFAAHLHVKFAAIVPHYPRPGAASAGTADKEPTHTKFLALDKVIPGRDFLQVFSLPNGDDCPGVLQYDPEWLAVVRRTHGLLSTSRGRVEVPAEVTPVTAEEIEWVSCALRRASSTDSLGIPTLPCIADGEWGTGNKQTDSLLKILQLEHVWTKPHVPGEAVEQVHAPPPPAPPAHALPLPDDSLSFLDDLQHRRDHLTLESIVSAPPLPAQSAAAAEPARADNNVSETATGAAPRRAFGLNLPPPKFS